MYESLQNICMLFEVGPPPCEGGEHHDGYPNVRVASPIYILWNFHFSLLYVQFPFYFCWRTEPHPPCSWFLIMLI